MCLSYIILIVKDGLKDFEAKIEKIRHIVLFIRSLSYRYQDFKFLLKHMVQKVGDFY